MRQDWLVFLMRVQLPDRPGSLGRVATALGDVGADINAVEIVDKGDGVVVDDFIVDLPPDQMPETMVTACNRIPGVSVQWISRYPEGGGLQSDLEALERMAADPQHAAETLVMLCPVVFRSHWAMLWQHGEPPTAITATTMAPDFSQILLDQLAPFDRTHRVDLRSGWLPGWGDSTVVIT